MEVKLVTVPKGLYHCDKERGREGRGGKNPYRCKAVLWKTKKHGAQFLQRDPMFIPIHFKGTRTVLKNTFKCFKILASDWFILQMSPAIKAGTPTWVDKPKHLGRSLLSPRTHRNLGVKRVALGSVR